MGGAYAYGFCHSIAYEGANCTGSVVEVSSVILYFLLRLTRKLARVSNTIKQLDNVAERTRLTLCERARSSYFECGRVERE